MSGNSAWARLPVLREIEAAASQMAMGEVIGSVAASSAAASSCASSSSVRIATMAEASTNTAAPGLVEIVAERLVRGPWILDPRANALAQRRRALPERHCLLPPAQLV